MKGLMPRVTPLAVVHMRIAGSLGDHLRLVEVTLSLSSQMRLSDKAFEIVVWFDMLI